MFFNVSDLAIPRICPLTTGLDSGTAFTGGSGNDTFNAVYDGAATGTLNVSDSLNGGAGTDILNITASDDAVVTLPAASVTGIETINIRNVDGDATLQILTVSGANFIGHTSINSNLSTDSLTLNNVASGASVGVIGNGTVTNGALIATYVAAATAATLNISGGTTAGAVILAGAGTNLVSTTVNSTGAANEIGVLTLAAETTTLTINATTDLTTGAVTNTTAAALTTLTVTGAGAVDISAGTLEATVATIDASANTGGLSVKLGSLVTQTVTGSAADDTITSGAVLTTGSVNAGAGTGDKLVLGTNVTHANTASLGAKYTGFEVLSVSGTISAANIVGLTSVEVTGATNNISGLTAAQAAAITATVDIGATTFALTTATGTADVLSLTMGTGANDATEATDATALTVTGFETVNIATNAGLQATAGALRTTTIASFGTPTTLSAINLTGTAVDLQNIATTVAVTINGSALIGDGAATSLGLTVGGSAVVGSTITGSAVGDRFTIAAEGSTYNGGAGNDIFTSTVALLVADGVTDSVLIGGTGTDTLAISDVGVTVTDNHFTTLSGFEKITTTTGSVSITTGGSFTSAFATGATITTGILADTSTFVYNGGLYGQNTTITIDGTSLQGIGNGEDVTVTTGAGADTVTFTGDATWVGAAGDAATITISTAAGADTISVTIGALAAQTTSQAIVITGGTGADAITKVGTNGTGATAAAKFIMASGDSNATAGGYDTITGFDVADGTNNADILDFAGTGVVGTLATTVDFGAIMSHSITAGYASFDDAAVYATALVINSTNLADVIGYLAANTATDDAVAFAYDSDASGTADATMVYSNQATDSLVMLVGITTGTLSNVLTTKTAGTIDIA